MSPKHPQSEDSTLRQSPLATAQETRTTYLGDRQQIIPVYKVLACLFAIIAVSTCVEKNVIRLVRLFTEISR